MSSQTKRDAIAGSFMQRALTIVLGGLFLLSLVLGALHAIPARASRPRESNENRDSFWRSLNGPTSQVPKEIASPPPQKWPLSSTQGLTRARDTD